MRDLEYAAEQADHDDYCGGCGFPNLSAGPCEVCGYDPETGEHDPDFIAALEADDDG